MIARTSIALALTASSALAQTPIFGAPAPYMFGTSITSVALGDMNGDGRLDIVAANNGLPISLSVLLGDGIGGFASEVGVPISNASALYVSLGDMNSDGKLDVITTDGLILVVLLGNGNGGVSAEAAYASGPGPTAIADINSDGKLDVVVANPSGPATQVLFGNGAGGFSGTSTLASTSNGVAIGDVNSDGNLDIVTDRGHVFLGNGSGGFASGSGFVALAGSCSIALGNLTSDGRLDVVIGTSGAGGVAVFYGDGFGGFVGPAMQSVGAQPRFVAIGDVDLDGKADIFSTDSVGNSISVLNGNGGGGFAPAVNYNVGGGSSALALGDLNANGTLDAVVARNSVPGLGVLMNLMGPQPLGYCFGDGTSSVCPCGTSAAGNGCPNSITASGARLASTGYAGVTNDTFKLVSTNVPNGPGLYFQGTGTTDLPFFGDGKFCAGIGVVRLGVTHAASNTSSYPDAVATTPIHTAGSIPGAGGTRYYQVWYRDTDPTFCTPSLFNLTNGLNVAWVP